MRPRNRYPTVKSFGNLFDSSTIQAKQTKRPRGWLTEDTYEEIKRMITDLEDALQLSLTYEQFIQVLSLNKDWIIHTIKENNTVVGDNMTGMWIQQP